MAKKKKAIKKTKSEVKTKVRFYFKAIHLLWVVPAIFMLALFVINIGNIQYHNSIVPGELIKQEVRLHWACMDGCSNMLERFDNQYGRDYLKVLHNECVNKCCNQYMLTLGCN